MKSIDEYFSDWENNVFGFGYGSGEPHTLAALRAFLAAIPDDGCYDYEVLEKTLSPTVCWLMINILCHSDIIEYGTSPRFGWLTPQGKTLRDYVLSKNVGELLVDAEHVGSDYYIPCYPTHCNCEGEKCNNPFWQATCIK